MKPDVITRDFSFRYGLPLGMHFDLDRVRHDAILACYTEALNQGMFPIDRPQVDLEQHASHNPDVFPGVYLRVSVRCAS